jgi:2,3-bisphosphoglycerate-independent phosphoglycerate mutase
MKAILIIGDGMADRPLKELEGKTPLEATEKPFLDELAKSGICGIIDPISPGFPPGSDVATLALLGYDALKVYTGRGALEAVGSGIEVLPTDIAFRCNFATVDKDLVVVDRRAGRIATEDAARLTEDIQKAVSEEEFEADVLFKNTVEHRAILRLRGPELSNMVSSSDPAYVGRRVQKIMPLDDTLQAARTAKIANKLMTFFHEILKNHEVNEKRKEKGLLPANIVLFRSAGKLPDLTPLTLKYGIRPAVICALPLIRGVCKLAGMKPILVEGATGTYATNVMAKAKAAVKALESYDFVLVHVKGTDLASHDGKVSKKMEMIVKIDGLVSYILENTDPEETYIAVTADHTTSIATGEHEGDPVPIVLRGPYVRTDDVAEFGERACAKGGLGRIRGKDLMPILMNFLGKVKKYGA